MALTRTYVGIGVAAGATAAARTATLDCGTVTAGDLLVIFSGIHPKDNDGSATVRLNTPTKSAGTATIGTVTKRTERTAAGFFPELGVWTVPVTGSGTLTISQTVVNNHFGTSISVVKYTGHDATTPTGGVANQSVTNAQLANSTLSAAPSTNDETLAFGSYDTDSGAGGWTPASGWTELADRPADWTDYVNVGLQVRAASTSTTVDWPNSSATTYGGAGVAVVIKVAASGGTTGTGAATMVRHAAAGSGSTAVPTVTGTSATTLVRVAGAGAGSSGTDGSSATTLVRHTGAGSGSTTAPLYPYVTQSQVSNPNSESPTVTFSTAPLENDIVVLFCSRGSIGQTLTIPSGWENPLGTTTDVETDAHQVCMVAHRVTSGEAGSSTVTFTATNLYGVAAATGVIGIVVRNVDATDMFDVAASLFNSGNTVTPHVLAGLTPTVDNGLMISCVAADAALRTFTEPSGWTTITSHQTTSGSWAGSYNTYTVASTPISATNITPNTSDEYASISVVFGPPDTAPTGTGAPTLTRHTGAGSGSTTAPGSTGTGAGALVRHVAAGAGSTGTSGAGSPSLVRVAGAGSGTTVLPSVSGSGAPSMVRHTASGAGLTTGPPTGTGAPVLARHTATGAGITGTSGAGAGVLTRFALAATGVVSVPGSGGSGAMNRNRHGGSGTGSTGTSGSGALSLNRHSGSGVGATGISGSGGLALVRHIVVGLPPVVGTAAVTLNRLTGAGLDTSPSSTGGRAGQTSGTRLLTGLSPDTKRSVILDRQVVTTETIPTWQDWTHNWSILSSLGDGTLAAKYRERDNVLELQLSFTDGATTTYGSGNQTLDLPAGYTTDSFCENIPAGWATVPGKVYWWDASVEEVNFGYAVPDASDNTQLNLVYSFDQGVAIGYDRATNVATNAAPIVFATGDKFIVDLQLPLV